MRNFGEYTVPIRDGDAGTSMAPWERGMRRSCTVVGGTPGRPVHLLRPPLARAYGASADSKGGLNLLTRSMAAEWGRFNIQADAAALTVILTEMGRPVWGHPAKGDPMKARIPARRFDQAGRL